MQQIIITGKPGAGKTTLLNRLKAHGFKTIDCDSIVSNLYKLAAPGYKVIKAHWGNQFINKKGVNKSALWEALTSQKISIEDLNKLIHPLINQQLQKAKFDFCECPIIGSLFLDKNKFKIIKLEADNDIAVARIMQRKDISYQKAQQIINLFCDNIKTNATFDTSNEIDETFVQKVINYCQSL